MIDLTDEDFEIPAELAPRAKVYFTRMSQNETVKSALGLGKIACVFSNRSATPKSDDMFQGFNLESKPPNFSFKDGANAQVWIPEVTKGHTETALEFAIKASCMTIVFHADSVTQITFPVLVRFCNRIDIIIADSKPAQMFWTPNTKSTEPSILKLRLPSESGAINFGPNVQEQLVSIWMLHTVRTQFTQGELNTARVKTNAIVNNILFGVQLFKGFPNAVRRKDASTHWAENIAKQNGFTLGWVDIGPATIVVHLNVGWTMLPYQMRLVANALNAKTKEPTEDFTARRVIQDLYKLHSASFVVSSEYVSRYGVPLLPDPFTFKHSSSVAHLRKHVQESREQSVYVHTCIQSQPVCIQLTVLVPSEGPPAPFLMQLFEPLNGSCCTLGYVFATDAPTNVHVWYNAFPVLSPNVPGDVLTTAKASYKAQFVCAVTETILAKYGIDVKPFRSSFTIADDAVDKDTLALKQQIERVHVQTSAFDSIAAPWKTASTIPSALGLVI